MYVYCPVVAKNRLKCNFCWSLAWLAKW